MMSRLWVMKSWPHRRLARQPAAERRRRRSLARRQVGGLRAGAWNTCSWSALEWGVCRRQPRPPQGLPDTLQRLDAAKQRRRRRRLLGSGGGRRLAQLHAGGHIPTTDAPAAPAPAPPFVAGTSFRVDLLQQRSDKAGPGFLPCCSTLQPHC